MPGYASKNLGKANNVCAQFKITENCCKTKTALELVKKDNF